MYFCRVIFLITISCWLISCNDLAKKIVEETIKEGNRKNSLKEEQEEFPISKDHFEVLERKKDGDDSLFLVRNFYLTKKKYSDCWYKNNQLHGIAKFYYPHERLSHALIYKNDLLTDLIESYFPDGTKRTDSNLKNGSGNIKLYHPITYKLYADCELKNGLKNGKYLSYYANGNQHESYTFINDSLVGNYIIRYKSGTIEAQRQEIKGKQVYSNFYPNSKPKKLEVWKNNLFLSSQSFDDLGNITESSWIENGEAKSIKSYYGSQNLLLSRGNYLNQKKHGNYEYFYDNGKKKAVELYDMDELLLETRWYENGNLSLEAKYKNGEYNGLYKEFYPNGKKRIEQIYVNGIKQGKYISYFDNGNRYNEGNFVDGKPKGPVKIYTREGKFDRIKEY